jgi:hypothetical protein
MKNLLAKSLVLSGLMTLASCRSDSSLDDKLDLNKANEASANAQEYKHINLLISDKSSNSLSFLNPVSGTSTSFDAAHPGTALYASKDQRYAFITEREKNYFSVFDSGVELHGDHLHLFPTKVFTPAGLFSKPTHVFSSENDLCIFNDGSGHVSQLSMSDIYKDGAKFNTIALSGAKAHHGAMVGFANGTYAITFDDNTVPNSSAALPERVKIADATGKIIYESTTPTAGIHGDDTDGATALFGSYGAVLKVKSNGEQSLINNPSNFGPKDILGSIYYNQGARMFVGSSGAKGLFEIDVQNNSIKPLLEATDIYAVVRDAQQMNMYTLHQDGQLSKIDLKSRQVSKLGVVAAPVSAADASNKAFVKPSIVATSQFVYVLNPSSSEIYQYRLANFAKTNTYKIKGQAYKFCLLGAELNK